MHAKLYAVHGLCAIAIMALSIAMPAPSNAHVIWSQTNSVNSDTVFLTHFTEVTSDSILPEAPLDPDLGLTPTSAQVELTTRTDVPSAIFGPQSLYLTRSQTLRSTTTLTGLDGDLTIEFWFKWLPTMTSSTLQVGLASGAKILIARDEQNQANDRFGISATHGSFKSANGFIDWPSVGEEEAGARCGPACGAGP